MTGFQEKVVTTETEVLKCSTPGCTFTANLYVRLENSMTKVFCKVHGFRLLDAGMKFMGHVDLPEQTFVPEKLEDLPEPEAVAVTAEPEIESLTPEFQAVALGLIDFRRRHFVKRV
jgi:hypothetical protein